LAETRREREGRNGEKVEKREEGQLTGQQLFAVSFKFVAWRGSQALSFFFSFFVF